jgi:hypothetical protein
VVYKWKTTTKEKFPQGIIVVQDQESGWKTDDLAEDQIKSIQFCGFNSWVNRYNCDPGVHSFQGHIIKKCEIPTVTRDNESRT